MIYYCVIDTNVLVSASLDKLSVPGQIFNLVKNNTIIPLLNEEIVFEYTDVLFRNKFKFNVKEVTKMLKIFVDKGIFLLSTKTEEYFQDKEDICFYEVVLTKRKVDEAFLVTGNKKHFPKQHFVVTPREMLDIVEKNKKNET